MSTRVRRKMAHEINVVPYIDVMLVLLIIFMVTAPLLTQGVEVDLPETGAESLAIPQEPVTLVVDSKGRYFLDIGTEQGKALDDDELVRRVRAVIKQRPDAMILIKGDRRVPYERVAYGMGLLQEAGASKIGFASESLTRPAPAKSEPAGP